MLGYRLLNACITDVLKAIMGNPLFCYIIAFRGLWPLTFLLSDLLTSLISQFEKVSLISGHSPTSNFP